MVKHFFIITVSLLIFMGTVLVTPAMVYAASIDHSASEDFKKAVNTAGGSEASSAPDIIKNVINILLYVAGVIAVIVIIVGGLRFVTSEGDANAANKAKNSVAYACVGLVLAALAYAIVNFVLGGII